MDDDQPEQRNWREEKRRKTLHRITEAALKLFVANGYEATTLDAIAEASDISRRTFFYYFKSKEEILAAWQQGVPEAFRAAILAEPGALTPLDVLRNAHLRLATNYDPRQTLVIDRIVRSSEQLRASNQAKFLRLEEVAFEALCELWPDAARRKALRTVAMVSVGVLRLAVDSWAEGQGRKPLVDHLQEGFASLRDVLEAPR